MDQRNSTDRSTAPVRADDGWHTYTGDHVALLDHLGVQKCHMMGMCIGPSFSLAVMKLQPERVAACVFLQPIGLAPASPEEGIPEPDNRQAFYDYNYTTWAPQRAADVDAAVLKQFFDRLYQHDFVFSATEADVGAMPHPMLVLMGTDTHHPSYISRRLAEVAPNAELLEKWKGEEFAPAFQRVLDFLKGHCPGSSPL